MATQRLSIYSFIPNEYFDIDKTVKKLMEKNDPSSYSIINEQGENNVAGCFLAEQLRNEIKYNILENRFETQTVTKLNILKFDINTTSQSLIIWGNKDSAQRFITILAQAADNKVSIDLRTIDFKSLLDRIINNPSITLSRIKLNDIVIDNGVVANCSVNLGNLDNPKAIIAKYKDNITQLSIVLGKNEFPDDLAVAITIYSTGSISIFKDRDSISGDIIDMIQNLYI
jgi:dephospho-CoA kinase